MENKRDDFRIDTQLEYKIMDSTQKVLFESNSQDPINLSMGGFSCEVPYGVALDKQTSYELHVGIHSQQRASINSVSSNFKSNKNTLVLPFTLLRQQKGAVKKIIACKFGRVSGFEGQTLMAYLQDQLRNQSRFQR